MHLKVGELSRPTGLTVRTLHHYDEIGLLKPSGRCESGYRLYGEAATAVYTASTTSAFDSGSRSAGNVG
jgi:hypothetical protein